MVHGGRWRDHFQLDKSKCKRVNTEVTTLLAHSSIFPLLRIEQSRSMEIMMQDLSSVDLYYHESA
jgi:hypothetical protein